MKKLDKAAIKAALESSGRKRPVSDGAIDRVLARLNQDQIYAEEQGKIQVVEWDRVSPINGVPAAEVLARRTDIIDGGKIYLHIRNGVVETFQPHDPREPGLKKLPQNALKVGEDERDLKAEGEMIRRVFEAIEQEEPDDDA